MKKLLAFIFAAIMLLLSVGCAPKDDPTPMPDEDETEQGNETDQQTEDEEPVQQDKFNFAGSVPADRRKHIEYFYSVDYIFLEYCQSLGYFPEDEDLNKLQDEYAVLFGCTEDGNTISFMDYYGIPDSVYIDYWTEKVPGGADPSYEMELNFDAWFSDEVIPSDQEAFISPDYPYDDPKSVFIRCADDEIHTDRYYTINGFLIKYVGEEQFDEFRDEFGGTEKFNILNFIDYFGISKEDFDGVFYAEDYHSISLPYKSEYLYGTEEMQELYLTRHPHYSPEDTISESPLFSSLVFTAEEHPELDFGAWEHDGEPMIRDFAFTPQDTVLILQSSGVVSEYDPSGNLIGVYDYNFEEQGLTAFRVCASEDEIFLIDGLNNAILTCDRVAVKNASVIKWTDVGLSTNYFACDSEGRPRL